MAGALEVEHHLLIWIVDGLIPVSPSLPAKVSLGNILNHMLFFDAFICMWMLDRKHIHVENSACVKGWMIHVAEKGLYKNQTTYHNNA